MHPFGHVLPGVATGCGGRVASIGDVSPRSRVGDARCRILSEAAIKRLRVWLHRVDMTVRYNEARANSSCDGDHKLGALLNYFLMPENMGVSLENIIGRVVAENVDALEVHLVKSQKVLKEASKMQTKLLTHVVKQKLALENGHPTEVAHEEAPRALRQTTEQLDRVRSTIAKDTAQASLRTVSIFHQVREPS